MQRGGRNKDGPGGTCGAKVGVGGERGVQEGWGMSPTRGTRGGWAQGIIRGEGGECGGRREECRWPLQPNTTLTSRIHPGSQGRGAPSLCPCRASNAGRASGRADTSLGCTRCQCTRCPSYCTLGSVHPPYCTPTIAVSQIYCTSPGKCTPTPNYCTWPSYRTPSSYHTSPAAPVSPRRGSRGTTHHRESRSHSWRRAKSKLSMVSDVSAAALQPHGVRGAS